MKHPLSHRVDGAIVGLAVVAAAALFMLVVIAGSWKYHQAKAAPDPLSQWSLARILAELGEYDTKIPDCAGLVEGMNGYAYARINTMTGQLKGVVIVCKP